MQKTAYEMRISDWSSDVCSSDLKTEGRLQQVARTLTRPLVLVVVAFMGLVSAWLPFLDSRIMARWFEGGNFWWLAPVPLLALLNALALWRAVMQQGHDARPDRKSTRLNSSH